MAQMYVEYRGDTPVAYRYGEEWVAQQLFMEGGYPTPEEAIAAWERESGSCDGCIYANRKRPQKCSCCRRNRAMKDCYRRSTDG